MTNDYKVGYGRKGKAVTRSAHRAKFESESIVRLSHSMISFLKPHKD